MTKEYFIGKCPDCSTKVKGEWDWEDGDICVQGYCVVCQKYLLEDEVDWTKQ